MQKVLKFSAMILFSVMLLTTAGCSSWWSNFRKDPVAQVQSIISTLDTVVTISTVIFSEVKMALPEAKRTEAQERFTRAVLAVEASKRMIRDALAVAEMAKDDSPNLQAVIQGALKSVESLRTLIRELQSLVRADAAANSIAQLPTKPDDLDAAVDSVRRWAH